ncbi:MAG: Uncharacterised protein [Pseudidiomarina mangrovi]|nr:MAG: Uncharacterised protein [Pseudidiomarina mangrovi]
MKTLKLVLVLLVSGAFANQALAVTLSQQDRQAAFAQAYADFEQAQQQQLANHQLEKLAQQAYRASADYFGDQHLNTANLKISYLNLVPLSTLTNEDSQRLADQVLEAYRANYDKQAVELMDALQAVLSTRSIYSELKPVKKLYSEVIDLADRHMDAQPEAMTMAKVEAGAHLLRVGSRDSRDLLDYAEEASKRLGPSHEITLLAQFQAGRYQEAAGDASGAEQRFRAVAAVPLADLSERLAIPKYMSHARLVVLLEAQGKSAEATEHCIAVAHMGYGVTDEQDPTPLFRVSPKYPILLAGRGVTGKVIAEYDISETGTVDNVRIIEADHKAFGDSSAEAIKQWRFAPRIDSGAPVKSTGHKVQMDFALD